MDGLCTGRLTQYLSHMTEIVMRASNEAEKIPTSFGELTWFANRKLGNSSDMTVGTCRLRPGQENPHHVHPNCSEVLVVLEGMIMHTAADGSEVEMSAGSTVSIPPGVPHHARNIGSTDALLLLSFSSADRQIEGR